MKSVLVFLAALLAVSQAGEPDVKYGCPQTYLSQLKPAVLKNYLGVWYVIRASPCDDEHANADCITQTIWRTKDTPATRVNSVCSSQTNETWEYEEGFATIKPTAVDGEVETNWQWKMGNKTIDSTFIESDNGQFWGIGHSCFLDDKGNLTSTWAILSRTKKMDASLEQKLVEKIEKYSGIPQGKLRGVRQAFCYEHDFLNHVNSHKDTIHN